MRTLKYQTLNENALHPHCLVVDSWFESHNLHFMFLHLEIRKLEDSLAGKVLDICLSVICMWKAQVQQRPSFYSKGN